MFIEIVTGTKVTINNSIYKATGSVAKTRKSEIDGEYEHYILLALTSEDDGSNITIEFWPPRIQFSGMLQPSVIR